MLVKYDDMYYCLLWFLYRGINAIILHKISSTILNISSHGNALCLLFEAFFDKRDI